MISRSAALGLTTAERAAFSANTNDLPEVAILVVDDREENLIVLESTLEPLGQRIVRARSGEAALLAVLEEQFAVILMDIRMPGLDGFETIALLRTRKRSSHIPIIFLTAHSEEEDKLRSYASGAVDCLQKPFEPDTLRAKVQVFVHLRQNELALQAARDELESRVAERTGELATANAALKREIEQRKQVEQRLVDQAHRDALTGLANRKLLLEDLRHAVARFHRQPDGPRFAIMMIDLDRFKAVNDTLGHLAGDRLLVEVATRLEACLRSVDTAARLGGDEFAVLLDQLDEFADATRVADRIHEALARPFAIIGREVMVSASIGIAVVDARYERGDDLLRDADTALYRAKDAGRARTQVFDQAMHEVVIAQLEAEDDLRAALERDQLRVVYQPVVRLVDGAPVAYEALVRWQHPTRGLLEPDAFLPLAEETGAIHAIGAWMLDHACAQLAAWRAEGGANTDLTIGVNISATQLARPGLATEVARSLHRHALPPGALELELTETTIMRGTRDETSELAALRELGVGLALDDFGTGYSCLATLHQLHVTTLKIDRSFVTPIGTPGDRPEILAAIVALATALDLRVVAEGIETAAQRARLLELGCTVGQGFLFGRPA